MPPTTADLSPRDIQAIADAYGLGPVTAERQTGKVLRLEARCGRFALRFSNAEATPAHLRATQAATRALADAGLPVAAPLAAPGGETALEVGGLWCELLPWVEHDGDGGSWAGLLAAAPALRRMHDALADCKARPDQRDDPWRSPAELADRLRDGVPALLRLAARSGDDLAGELGRTAEILAALRDSGALDACPRQLTHGDYQGPNLLLRGGQLAAIVDFERLELRPRLYDLAWPLVFWRWYGTDLGSYAERDWQAARACCAAYAAAGPPLDQPGWEALPFLMALIPARGIAEAAAEDEPVAEVRAFARALAFAEECAFRPADVLARLRPAGGREEAR